MINRDHSDIKEWYLLGGAGILLFFMALAGFARYATWHTLNVTFWDNAYLTLQLIPLNSGGLTQPIPIELNLARFLIPAWATAAAVKAFLKIFQEQIHQLRLHRVHDHIVICGLSRKGYLLAQGFRAAGVDVVVIEQDDENKWLEACRDLKVFVLMGDATERNVLHQARLPLARGMFIVCEEDGGNANIFLQAQALVEKRDGMPLKCMVHISDPQLCALLRLAENALERTALQLELFNVYEQGARQMVQAFPAWNREVVETGDAPHVLIVGLGWLGENVALHLARDWWRQPVGKRHPLQITVVDLQAAQKTASLLVRFPQLQRACQFHPLNMNIHSSEYEQARFLNSDNGHLAITHAYICLDNDSLGLHAGLTLHRQTPVNKMEIVIRMAEEDGLARLLQNRKRHDKNLHAFGYLNRTCTTSLLDETPGDYLARAAHEQYLQHQAKMAQADGMDPSLQPWERLDKGTQANNYRWVFHISQLLGKTGYRLAPLDDWDAPMLKFSAEEVECMAELEHQLWIGEKVRDGWRYAPGLKNPASKTHPDLVAWAGLPEGEKEKNRTLVMGLPSFLERAGFQITVIEPRGEEILPQVS